MTLRKEVMLCGQNRGNEYDLSLIKVKKRIDSGTGANEVDH